MRHSTLKEEIKLWKSGYHLVAGIDEVGRGPLAGPVVACAVAIIKNPKFEFRNSKQYQNSNAQNLKLRDSKQLSQKQREELYTILINHPAIEWGIGRVYPSVIDRINIFQATKLAMTRAIRHLEQKIQESKSLMFLSYSMKTSYIDFIILDGNMRLDVEIPQFALPKADEKVFSCAAASIIAKVKRDRLMKRYHKKYGFYGFDTHKGYGTKVHITALREHGPCYIHRKSFAPVLDRIPAPA